MNPCAEDGHGDNALILAIKAKKAVTASYLVSLDKIDLLGKHQRTGLNYFGYAVDKGCFVVAYLIVEKLKQTLNEDAIHQSLNA